MSKVHPMRFALLATVASAAMLPAAAFAADDSIVTQRGETQVAQAAPAAAPAGGDGMLEEIIVSGFRQSIQASLEQKKNATQVVEVITAEDIGKLPDNSIAESIARLPGIAAQRIDGRAQSISLRGLGPDFTTTLLNGREQVTTGNNRSVEFDQYPAEISSGVAVYKTSQSNVIGQGLAGTVDLKTIRPLDYKERVLSVSARTEYVTNGKLNSDSDEYGYRFSGTYVDHFANDTMGISIGVSHLMQPTQIKSARFWGDGNYPRINDSQPLSDTAPYIIGGGEFRSNSQTLKRTGVVATWQWQPSDNFTSTTDFYYSKFDDVQYQRGVELPLWWSGAQLSPASVKVEDALVTAGSFSGVKGVGRSDIRTTKADLYSAGWNGQYNKDEWTVTADLGYSSADRKSSRFEAYFGTGRNGVGATDTVGFTSKPDDFGWQLTHNLNYADPNLMLLTDPGGWSGGSIGPLDQNGYLNTPSINDELYSARFDVRREIESNAFSAIDVGVNYTDRKKEYTQPEWYVVTTANVQNPTAQRSIAVPTSSLLKPTDLSWIGLGDTLAFDPRDLLANGTYSLVKCPRDNCQNDSGYDIVEKVWTAFAKIDLDAQLGSVGLTGNIGAQYIHTDQSSTGPAITKDPVTNIPKFTLQTGGAKYSNFLPSVNLIFTMPNDDHKIRLSGSRQMARARPDQLSALSTYNYNAARYNQTDIEFSPWSAGGDNNGNPKLKPWVADALDATYEYYFADAGYMAINGYYKWLKTYIYKEKQIMDFTGFPVTGPQPTLWQGYSERQANGNGGDIYGAEFALALPFDLLSEALDGFGMTGNVGYTKTTIQPNPGDPAQPIPGFSKYTAAGTLYYDKNGFQARISANYRSKFLAEVTGFGQGRALRMGKGETIYDAQVSYEFQEGSQLQGLTVMLQGYNLSNEPFIAYGRGDTRLVERYEDYGSRYLLGVSYKF
ncbi:TonB-dependent receptor [Niveispirillum sp.]|uniref:TonB-dependent receptor n=1 Tax=Niveispirillum sp. TaxID=1917217 RepID=UPI001B72B6CD|nr:TonB-dependent receptor [Niveispirillum sp.]MBP7334439.1 TonB-dependent receptor [Niveispirillum sp.]